MPSANAAALASTFGGALADGKRGAAPANLTAVVPADKTKLAKLQSDVNRLTAALQVTMEGQLEASKRELREAYEEIGLLKASKRTAD